MVFRSFSAVPRIKLHAIFAEEFAIILKEGKGFNNFSLVSQLGNT